MLVWYAWPLKRLCALCRRAVFTTWTAHRRPFLNEIWLKTWSELNLFFLDCDRLSHNHYNHNAIWENGAHWRNRKRWLPEVVNTNWSALTQFSSSQYWTTPLETRINDFFSIGCCTSGIHILYNQQSQSTSCLGLFQMEKLEWGTWCQQSLNMLISCCPKQIFFPPLDSFFK